MKLETIRPLDKAAMAQAKAQWDAVAKPLNSLGRLEQLVVQMAGITGSAAVQAAPACVLVCCADNGVVAEGVSQSGQDVTRRVAQSISAGEANVNLMAQAASADVFCVDMGMAERVQDARILDCSPGHGTANMTLGPAMTRAEAERAVTQGMALAADMRRRGYRIIATGEMGIGNTTTSAAVASALLGIAPERIVGRGAGLSDSGLARKLSAVQRALAVNQPRPDDALDVLHKVGGFDLAGLMGIFLGGAQAHVPVIADGMISCTAALLAERLCPATRDYVLPSHQSREPAGRLVLDALALHPVLHGDMALGEGTGAVMLLPLLDMALRVYHGAHTFRALEMAAYTPQEEKT